MSELPDGAAPSTGARLRRELSVWEAVGISVALMAPSAAVNIIPQATAGVVGRAVPLTFVLATVGVLLIAYTFVRLCQRFHHTGSVYGFVGATLGPRSGAIAGWALLGTYTLIGVATVNASSPMKASASRPRVVLDIQNYDTVACLYRDSAGRVWSIR